MFTFFAVAIRTPRLSRIQADVNDSLSLTVQELHFVPEGYLFKPRQRKKYDFFLMFLEEFPDGIFGDLTSAAVSVFPDQLVHLVREVGWDPDGVVFDQRSSPACHP